MKKQIKQMVLIAMCSIILTSCATLFTGKSQTVTFTSNINDATVYQNQQPIGKTNYPIEIKRKDLNKLFTIKTEGCPEKNIELQTSINPVIWANIPLIFVGLFFVGTTVDLATGASIKADKTVIVNIDCAKK